MKAYVQFYKTKGSWSKENGFQYLPGEHVEACGSDGVFILDGRNSLETQIQDAKDRMFKLRNVQNFSGFAIMKGDLRNAYKRVFVEISTVEIVGKPSSARL